MTTPLHLTGQVAVTEGVVGLSQLRGGGLQAGAGHIDGGAGPVDIGAADEVAGVQAFGPPQIGLGQLQLAAGRHLFGAPGVDQRLQVGRIDPGQYLTGMNTVAHIHGTGNHPATGLEGVGGFGAGTHVTRQGPAGQQRTGSERFRQDGPGRLLVGLGLWAAACEQGLEHQQKERQCAQKRRHEEDARMYDRL